MTLVDIQTLKQKPSSKKRGYWIFSNDVEHLSDALLDSNKCALVRIQGTTRFGIYCKSALIAVRLLPESFVPSQESQVSHEEIQKWAWGHLSLLRIQKEALPIPKGDALRWSHGDVDGMPGLVVDDYGEVCVLQSGSASGDFLLPDVAEALLQNQTKALFERSSGQIRAMDGLAERTRWLRKPQETEANPSFVTTKMSNLTMTFNPLRAQKTGLFLDQRENLSLLATLLPRVAHQNSSSLDICSYAGAWSAVAAREGFTECTIVDQDKDALEYAKRNIAANAKSAVEIVALHGDMFEQLSKLDKSGNRYTLVVADPPAFAKSKTHIPEARRAYGRLTKLASRLVEDDGILVVCSCSRNMEESELYTIVTNNLCEGRWVLMGRGRQSPDHTVIAGEGHSDYLKAFFFKRTRYF